MTNTISEHGIKIPSRGSSSSIGDYLEEITKLLAIIMTRNILISEIVSPNTLRESLASKLVRELD